MKNLSMYVGPNSVLFKPCHPPDLTLTWQPEHTWTAQGRFESKTTILNIAFYDTHIEALQNVVVRALSTMLAANYPESSDILVRLSAPSDPQRATNLAILSGTLSHVHNLSVPVSRDASAELIDILTAPDLSLALSIVDLGTSSEHEVILDLLLNVLSLSGMETKLLQAVIQQEVSTTGETSGFQAGVGRSTVRADCFLEIEHESILFRGNSAATRLLTIFARTRGYSYLRFLISNLLSALAQQPLDLSDLDMFIESNEVDEGLMRLEVRSVFGLLIRYPTLMTI